MTNSSVYIDDNRGIIYSGEYYTKSESLRISNNHVLEEARLSLKIAKFNVNIDPSNKYYLDQLEKAKQNFENVKVRH
jgi:hypothetical protein